MRGRGEARVGWLGEGEEGEVYQAWAASESDSDRCKIVIARRWLVL
jgi:hypothetical protein